MTQLVERDVEEHAIPVKENNKFHPEKCIIRFGSTGRMLDIGALCYKVRSKKPRTRSQKVRAVDLASFDKVRTDVVRKFIYQLSADKSMDTLLGISGYFIQFVDFCDNTDHARALETKQAAQISFRAYIEHLREKINIDILNINSAVRVQNTVAHLLNSLFDVDDFVRGMRLLRKNEKMTNTTVPPGEREMGEVLCLCESFFREITDHIVNFKTYPFKLTIPDYLGWTVEYMWVFPIGSKFMTPQELQRRTELPNPNWSLDFHEGRLASLDNVMQHYNSKRGARFTLASTEENINRANSDRNHYRRRQLARVAQNSFLVMFLANTGMNIAQVRSLRWDAKYTIESDTQGFKQIKYRAGGKPVSFQIEAGFLVTFKRYLELRSYLLNGNRFDFLFAATGASSSSKQKQLGPDVLSNFYAMLSRIDPKLPKILARQWRAAKSDYLIRNYDPSTAAIVLQNSERTILRHYATGSETRSIEEMGQFYKNLSNTVLGAGVPLPSKGVDGAVGSCVSFGEPKMTDVGAPIVPDCHQPEGCLFCNKYVIHADARDTRKLLSCHYFLNKTMNMSASEDHFLELFGEVIRRIDFILGVIQEQSDDHAQLVNDIRHEVETEGLLDSYWEGKLSMMIELGVVRS